MVLSSIFCVKPQVLLLPNAAIPVSIATRKGHSGMHIYTEQHFGLPAGGRSLTTRYPR